MAAPVAATPSASAGCSVRAKDVFAKGSRLSSRADVRAITSDGEELWLHRMVLEMWSSLFAELCVAAEEAPEADAGSAPGGAPSAVVTIHLSDTAQELLPLLSCLYPTLAGTGAGARAANDEDGDAAGLSGAKLDASTALPLLRLADKYDIPHVIATAAATMTDHVIPRLAAAPTAAAAASYLQLQLPLAEGSAAASAEEEEAEAEAGVAEWVVCAVEAAARLGLRELEDAGVELLAAKFYDWGLQACPHLLVRLVHCLPPDALVGGLLCALTPTPPPPPPPVAHLAGECKDQHGPAASSGSSRLSSRLQQRSYATGLPPHRQPRGRAAAGGRQVAAGEGNGGGAAVAGAVGGGGGPRIVPVVIAAAGPAAAVAGAPPLLGPHHHHNHHNHLNHHNHNHHHHQFHNHVAAAGLPAAAAAAAAVPLHGPQPLLQPHPAAAVPVHPHLAMPVAVPVPAVVAAAPAGGGVGVGGAGGPAVHQPHPFAEVAAGGAVGGGGAVGVPVAFGAGAGAPPPPMFQHHHHHQHQPHQQHQHQQPEPFWGGGHAGGVMGPL